MIDFVVSLELARNMKESLFPQEGAQFYHCFDGFSWTIVSKTEKEQNDKKGFEFEYVAAYLSDEMVEWLPYSIEEDFGFPYEPKRSVDLEICPHCILYGATFHSDKPKPADRYSEALLWLAKEGRIEPKNLCLMK